MKLYKTEKEAFENASKDHDFLVEDFLGKNCNEIEDNYCSGWDTKSRRCNCGNRRVEWESRLDEDDMWYVVAEAY